MTRGRTAGWWWLALSAAAIAVFAPLPYITASLHGLAEDNKLAANYADRPLWAQVAFYVHVGFGGSALLLSPAQFAARLRARVPRLHRACGRVVLASIVVAGCAGLVLAPLSLAGPVGTAGFGTLAALWVGFAAMAYRTIRRGDVTAHRRWVFRTFALTYAAVTLRLWLGLLVPLQMGVFDLDEDTAFDRAYHLVPFLAWVPNLLLVERLLRGRNERPRPAQALAGTRPTR